MKLNGQGFYWKIMIEKTFIYAIGFENDQEWIYIKIGKSSHRPDSRIKGLQTGNPFTLKLIDYVEVNISDAYRIERDLHIELKKFKVKGEWFLFKDQWDYAFFISAICNYLEEEDE
jgi:hypothetical protein